MGKWLKSRAWRPGVVFAAALVASGLLFAALTGAGQQRRKPASKADLIGLLDAGVPSSEIEKLVRDYGVSFELTPEAESDLRKAGATDDLIKAVRAVAPKPAAPPVLEIQSTPSHAQVYVDDAFSGQTSEEGRLRVLSLTPGSHRLRLTHDGYHDSQRPVDLVAGQTASITVNLEKLAPPSITLVPELTTIEKGQSVTLAWMSENATELALEPGVGTVEPKGSRTFTPSDSTTYTLSAKGPGGTVSATSRVTVKLPPPPPPKVVEAPENVTQKQRAGAPEPSTNAGVEVFRVGHVHGFGRACFGQMTIGDGFVRYRSENGNGHSFDFPLGSIVESKERGVFGIDFYIRLKDGTAYNFNSFQERSRVLDAIHGAMGKGAPGRVREVR